MANILQTDTNAFPWMPIILLLYEFKWTYHSWECNYTNPGYVVGIA